MGRLRWSSAPSPQSGGDIDDLRSCRKGQESPDSTGTRSLALQVSHNLIESQSLPPPRDGPKSSRRPFRKQAARAWESGVCNDVDSSYEDLDSTQGRTARD